jgi:hypothetical protein
VGTYTRTARGTLVRRRPVPWKELARLAGGAACLVQMEGDIWVQSVVTVPAGSNADTSAMAASWTTEKPARQADPGGFCPAGFCEPRGPAQPR